MEITRRPLVSKFGQTNLKFLNLREIEIQMIAPNTQLIRAKLIFKTAQRMIIQIQMIMSKVEITRRPLVVSKCGLTKDKWTNMNLLNLREIEIHQVAPNPILIRAKLIFKTAQRVIISRILTMSNAKTIMTICHLKHLHKKVKSAKDGMSLSKNHSLLAMKAYDASIVEKLPSDKKIPVKLKKEGEDTMKKRQLSADSLQSLVQMDLQQSVQEVLLAAQTTRHNCVKTPIKKLTQTWRYSTRDLIPTL